VQPQSCDLRVYSTGDSYSQLIFSADNIPVGQAANIYLPVYTSDNNVNYTVFFINAFSQIIENSETYSIWGGYSSDGEVNSNQLIDVSIGNSEYLQ